MKWRKLPDRPFAAVVELPVAWKDPRIQSSASYLGQLANGTELDPEKLEDAKERLIAAAKDLELFPDELFRAMVEHDYDLVPWSVHREHIPYDDGWDTSEQKSK